MSVSLNTFICSPVAASSRYDHPAPHPTAAPSRELGYHFSAQMLSTRVVFAFSRGRAASDPRDSRPCSLRVTTRLSSRARGPARLAATRLPISSPKRVVCASCGEARAPKCAALRGPAARPRRAFVAATGLVLCFLRRELRGAPPTNVDDMEARKMARERCRRRARAAARRRRRRDGGARPRPRERLIANDARERPVLVPSRASVRKARSRSRPTSPDGTRCGTASRGEEGRRATRR